MPWTHLGSHIAHAEEGPFFFEPPISANTIWLQVHFDIVGAYPSTWLYAGWSTRRYEDGMKIIKEPRKAIMIGNFAYFYGEAVPGFSEYYFEFWQHPWIETAIITIFGWQ